MKNVSRGEPYRPEGVQEHEEQQEQRVRTPLRSVVYSRMGGLQVLKEHLVCGGRRSPQGGGLHAL